jgi:hypothetical protein
LIIVSSSNANGLSIYLIDAIDFGSSSNLGVMSSESSTDGVRIGRSLIITGLFGYEVLSTPSITTTVWLSLLSSFVFVVGSLVLFVIYYYNLSDFPLFNTGFKAFTLVGVLTAAVMVVLTVVIPVDVLAVAVVRTLASVDGALYYKILLASSKS